MTDPVHDHGHAKDNSLDRLLFFSDGVFAIAITLLSIELHPPHDWDGTAATLWSEGWPGFTAYALSFLVIGIFWTSHRRIFTQVNRFTTGIFLFNLILLGLIALMPFMTNLLYLNVPNGEGFLIYLSIVTAAGLAQGALLAWAVFVDRAVDPRVHSLRRISGVLASGLLPGLCSAGTILSLGAFKGGVPFWMPAAFLAAIVVVVAFRSWTERRFP